MQYTFTEVKTSYISKLSGMYEPNEILSILRILASHYTGRVVTYNELNSQADIPVSVAESLYRAMERLFQGEPVQYITGRASFYDLELSVNPSVLIPRQETEYLTDILVKKLKSRKGLKILDACTGSGCIALALKQNLPECEITAIDISPEALLMAIQNAQENKLEINFILDDILNPGMISDNFFDWVVSNPPYVCESERLNMHINVLNHEPAKALFVPDTDPLLFYRALIKFCSDHLNSGGSIAFEINEAFGKEVMELNQTLSFKKTEIVKDLNSKDRFLIAEGYEGKITE